MKYSDINWTVVRKSFPALKKYVYLDANEVSPIPQVVRRRVDRFYEQLENHGVMKWDLWEKETEKTRASVAKMIGSSKDDVAFTTHTSHGMNIIADMLKKYSHVVTMEDEYPTSTVPWLHRGYKVSFIKPVKHTYPIEHIRKNIPKGAKILVTSHVQYCTGFRQDLIALGKLCEELGLIFVANATQSIGVMPIDVKRAHIDFLTFAGYKWALSGFGIGALYIRKSNFKRFGTPLAGGESIHNPTQGENKKLNLRKDIRVLEIGTPFFQSIFALKASVEFLQKIGISNVQRRIFELNSYLRKRLEDSTIGVISPIDKKHWSGITVIDVSNPKKTAQMLEKKDVIISARKHGLRVTTHVYNNEKDIARLISALKVLV